MVRLAVTNRTREESERRGERHDLNQDPRKARSKPWGSHRIPPSARGRFSAIVFAMAQHRSGAILDSIAAWPRPQCFCRLTLGPARFEPIVSNPNGPQGLNATFQITNPITETLTTNKPVYQLGEPVQVTFTEVNTASVPVTDSFPASGGRPIFHNGAPLWAIAYPQVDRP